MKAIIPYAALLEDISVSEYIRHAVAQTAENTSRQGESTLLSERASRALIASFLDPQEPNDALKRARAWHAEMIISSEK